MGKETEQAAEEVVNARRALISEVDELGSATRSALDVPAKVRRNPVQTAALAGGAAFLAVGGPKRVLRAAERRLRPTKSQRLKGILPKDVEKSLERMGDRGTEVREKVEQDFYDWLNKRRSKDAPASARQSLWKTYDVFVGPLGALAAKALAERLFAADEERARGERPGKLSLGDNLAARAGKNQAKGQG